MSAAATARARKVLSDVVQNWNKLYRSPSPPSPNARVIEYSCALSVVASARMASSVSRAWSPPAIAISSSDFVCRMRNDDDCLRPFGKAAFTTASRFALCYDCAFSGCVHIRISLIVRRRRSIKRRCSTLVLSIFGGGEHLQGAVGSSHTHPPCMPTLHERIPSCFCALRIDAQEMHDSSAKDCSAVIETGPACSVASRKLQAS